MSNEIKTTMTMDQAQMLRELQRQNVSLLKNAQAFLEVAKAAQKSGAEVKQGFDLSLPSVRQLSTSIVGFGTLTQGVMGGIRKAVKLTIAEYDKLKNAQRATIEEIPEPAALQRQLAFNLTPAERAGMGAMVGRIQQKTGARLQESIPVLSDASSARGQLGPKEIEAASIAALKLAGPHPMNTPTARELASRTLDLMDIHKQQTGELLTPEAMLGVISGLQIGARPVSIQQTAMSGLPAIAAMARQGQDIQSAAAFWASLTQLVKDPHGERERQSVIDTASELMTFSVETPVDHVQRLNTMFEDALSSADFPGTRDEKVRQKLRNQLADQKIRDPQAFSEAAAKILRDDATVTFHGKSESRARLVDRAGDIQKAGRHQRTQDEFGNLLDVPVEQVESVKKLKSPMERLEAISKLPELREAFAARAQHFGATVAKAEIKAFIRGNNEVWSQYRETKKIVPAPSAGLAKNVRSEVESLNQMPLQTMAQGLQETESNVQRQKLGQTYNQRRASAQSEVDRVLDQSHLGYAIDVLVKKNAPRVVDWLAGGFHDSPEQLEINIAESALRRVEQFLESETNTVKRGDWEADRQAFRSLIDRLKKQQQSFRKNPPPPGRKVGMITAPIKQRLRPDIDFMTADTNGDIARQMALVQRPDDLTEKDFATFDQQWNAERDAEFEKNFKVPLADANEGQAWMQAIAQRMVAAPGAPEPQRQPLVQREVVAAQPVAAEALRPSAERIREDVIQQALSTAQAESLPGVSREGLETMAGQWGDDVSGFTNKVRDFFYSHAERRREDAARFEVDVDPTTGSGKAFQDPSVDRLFRAGGQIEDAPFRETRRTDSQKRQWDFLAKKSEQPLNGPAVAVRQDEEALPDPRPLPAFELAGLTDESESESEDGAPVDPLTTAVVRREKYVEPKVFRPSDPERFTKAQEAVRRSHEPKAPTKRIEPKPFRPSDPERFAKAQRAVEESRRAKRMSSAERREGLDQSLLSAFSGGDDGQSVTAGQSAGPGITVQGGDTKPVVGEIKNTNQLIEQLLGQFKEVATLLKNKQPSQASRDGRERTSTRPAAALSAGRG